MPDFQFVDHDLVPEHRFDDQVRYELKPVRTPDGSVAEGVVAVGCDPDGNRPSEVVTICQS